MTCKPHIGMSVSKSKNRMSQLYHLGQFLDVDGLSLMYKAFICSCLEYGHLLFYRAANSHLCRLDSLQRRADGMCSTAFSSLSSRSQAAAVGLICKLLDGQGRGILQSFCSHFATYSTKRSSHLSASNDPARDYRLTVLGSFKSLEMFLHNWNVSAIQAWNSLPAPLLTNVSKWCDVMKTLQHYVTATTIIALYLFVFVFLLL